MKPATKALYTDTTITTDSITAIAAELVERSDSWKGDLRLLVERSVDAGHTTNDIAAILGNHRDSQGRPVASRPWILGIAKSYRLRQEIQEILEPEATEYDDILGDTVRPGSFNLVRGILGSTDPRLPTVDLFSQATARDAWVALEFAPGSPGPTRAAAQLIVQLLRNRIDRSLDIRGDATGTGDLAEWLASGTPEQWRTVQIRKLPEGHRPA